METEPSPQRQPSLIALLVPLRDRVGLVALSREYRCTLKPLSDERSHDEVVEVHIRRASDAVHVADAQLASLTVLYGENGCGKTHLMLDASNSLANNKGRRDVGIIWEEGGTLFYDLGSVLKRQVALVTHLALLQPVQKRGARVFPVVFYTTSPFEATKRRELSTRNVHDVTPSFSPDNPFAGADLLRAFGKLPEGFSFIEEAEARLRVKIPSLHSVLQKFTTRISGQTVLTRESDFFPDSSRRRALTDFVDKLYPDIGDALALEMLMALHFATDRGHELFSELVRAAADIDEPNPRRSGVTDAYRDPNGFVLSLLRHKRLRYAAPSSLLMQEFLTNSLAPAIRSLGRRAGLGAWTSAFDNFRVDDWEMFRNASLIGVVKWSFRGLSSGQVALLMLFSSLATALNRLESRYVDEREDGIQACIFIDEGEMFMHPAWQRRYITDLVNFISHYPLIAKKIHLVVATHSMIVAADAPPNRLFDVRTGEMTNGFGYGPTDVLGRVYHVDEFQGENAGRIMQRLVDFLTDRGGQEVDADDASEIADQIADERLRKYLMNEVRRHTESRNA